MSFSVKTSTLREFISGFSEEDLDKPLEFLVDLNDGEDFEECDDLTRKPFYYCDESDGFKNKEGVSIRLHLKLEGK